MNLADEVDLRILDVASKTAFGAVERARGVRRWWNHRVAMVNVFRTRNPAMFEQIVIVGVAGVLELITAWLGRPKR